MTAGFGDDVRPASAGLAEQFGGPVGMVGVVDREVSAELAGQFQFFIARGGDGHLCPMGLGDLQCPDRDTASSEREDKIARLDLSDRDHGIPRSHRCRGERRGLFIREIVRHAHQRVGGDLNVFGEPAVVRDADIVAKGAHRERAIQPGDEVRKDSAIANGYASCAFAERDDFAHALGGWHAFGSLFGAITAFDHLHVAVIEADQTHLQHGLAGAGDRVGTRYLRQCGNAVLRADFICFHVVLLNASMMSAPRANQVLLRLARSPRSRSKVSIR